ncbi:uncharacterized protein LOC134748527 [Cydia strobilella]|uniref:uncharacterized protein LOC134748527 n=1 Tax=Cydia strobilella TaxID=1100964 RepID=UPI003004DBEA
MGKYRLSYVFLCLVQFCFSAVQIHEANEDTEINKCITTIIQQNEILNTTADVTLINVNQSLSKELYSLLEHPVRFISRSFYWPNDTLFNYIYVIQCKDYFMFAQGLDLVRRDPFWNPRAKFLIVVEYIEDFLQEISDFLVYNHIYDVALVAYDENQSVVVYTFGLEHDECDRPVFKILQVLSRCSEIHNVDKIYAGARKISLPGCHVKFVSHNYWPFVSFNGEQTIEQYVLELIYQYENISVELINFGNVESFGSRLDNFTYTGMLHEIETYKVEGAMGGYVLTLNRMLNLDFINPFLVDQQKVVIARANLLSKWYGVLKQLGVLTVWSIFATFGLACATVIFMKMFQKRVRDTSRDFLIVWGYFLGNISQKQKSKSGIPYRLVLLSILIYVFVLTCAIQASLLSATTQPIRDDQPNLMEEVFSNYQLIVSPTQYGYLMSSTGLNVTNALTTCKLTLECMMTVMNNPDKRLFTVASDIYHRSYVWRFSDENGELKIHKIKESFVTLLQTMYIRRGSSLAKPFNRLLLRAMSGGLIDKFVDLLHFSARLKYKFHRKKNGPQTLKGLRVVFMVLISGYSISFISFILEYLQHRFHNMAF